VADLPREAHAEVEFWLPARQLVAELGLRAELVPHRTHRLN